METRIQPIAEADSSASMGVPTVFCNRFYVMVGPVVRIAFAEQEIVNPKAPVFRMAVALAHQDAIALANILKELLRPVEEQIDAATAAQNADTRNG
jgi:hypothetical protein